MRRFVYLIALIDYQPCIGADAGRLRYFGMHSGGITGESRLSNWFIKNSAEYPAVMEIIICFQPKKLYEFEGPRFESL